MNPLGNGAQDAKPGKRPEEFSLLGGPLYRLGYRLHLLRGNTNTIPMGLALGVGAWAVLVLLSVVEGLGPQLFSLALLGSHVRLLLVIPIFFMGEAWVDPRMAEFVRTIMRSGVVAESSVPALQKEIAGIVCRKESWSAEGVCLLLAAVPLLAPQLVLTGAVTTGGLPWASLTVQWYWLVCLTLFRFLMFRWLWRLWLWWSFLWRLSKLNLRLIPTHPDRAAGLGYLEIVQTHFIPLIVAFSAVESATLAEQIVAGTVAFEAIYSTFIVVILVDAALFLGPLFIFTPKLWACWSKGVADYMDFAARYVQGFDRKWLREEHKPEEPLLGTPDLQSLADLANSVDVVVNMKRVPASLRLPAEFLLAALLPMLPLFLLKYPIAELAQKLLARLVGL